MAARRHYAKFRNRFLANSRVRDIIDDGLYDEDDVSELIMDILSVEGTTCHDELSGERRDYFAAKYRFVKPDVDRLYRGYVAAVNDENESAAARDSSTAKAGCSSTNMQETSAELVDESEEARDDEGESSSSDISDDESYEVETIFQHMERNGKMVYKVKWHLKEGQVEDWSDSENWVEQDDMGCPVLMEKYWDNVARKEKEKKDRLKEQVDEQRRLAREREKRRKDQKHWKTGLGVVFQDADTVESNSDDDGSSRSNDEEIVLNIQKRGVRPQTANECSGSSGKGRLARTSLLEEESSDSDDEIRVDEESTEKSHQNRRRKRRERREQEDLGELDEARPSSSSERHEHKKKRKEHRDKENEKTSPLHRSSEVDAPVSSNNLAPAHSLSAPNCTSERVSPDWQNISDTGSSNTDLCSTQPSSSTSGSSRPPKTRYLDMGRKKLKLIDYMPRQYRKHGPCPLRVLNNPPKMRPVLAPPPLPPTCRLRKKPLDQNTSDPDSVEISYTLPIEDVEMSDEEVDLLPPGKRFARLQIDDDIVFNPPRKSEVRREPCQDEDDSPEPVPMDCCDAHEQDDAQGDVEYEEEEDESELGSIDRQTQQMTLTSPDCTQVDTRDLEDQPSVCNGFAATDVEEDLFGGDVVDSPPHSSQGSPEKNEEDANWMIHEIWRREDAASPETGEKVDLPENREDAALSESGEDTAWPENGKDSSDDDGSILVIPDSPEPEQDDVVWLSDEECLPDFPTQEEWEKMRETTERTFDELFFPRSSPESDSERLNEADEADEFEEDELYGPSFFRRIRDEAMSGRTHAMERNLEVHSVVLIWDPSGGLGEEDERCLTIFHGAQPHDPHFVGDFVAFQVASFHFPQLVAECLRRIAELLTVDDAEAAAERIIGEN